MPVRRSTRSNRGVNMKHDVVVDPVKENKRKNESNGAKTSGKRVKTDQLKHDPKLTEEEEVRCLPCGLWSGNYNEEEETDPKFDNWIECSRCKLWQHTFCMFGNPNAKVPKDYKCDICDSNNTMYDHLKRKMSYDRWVKLRFPDGAYGNVQDPLEEDLDAFEGQQDDDEDKDIVKDNADADVDANVEEDEDLNLSDLEDEEEDEEGIMEEDKDIEEDDDDEVIVRPKAIRKAEVFKENRPKRTVVTKKKASPGTKKQKISNSLQTKRNSIIKGFSIVIKKLIPDDDIELLKGKTIDALTNEWSSELESVIFELFSNSDTQYTNKCRSLLQNIKGSNLIERVISGEFEIPQLPKLTTEEMKTKEEKERDQRIREKELNKSVIKTSINTVPQVKITHKGEEVLENADYQFDDPTSSYVNDKRIEELEKLKDELEEKKRGEEHKRRESAIIEDQSLRNVFHAHAAGFDEYEDNRRDDEEPEQKINEELKEEEGNEDEDNADRFADDDDEFDNIINGTRKNDEEKPQTEPEVEPESEYELPQEGATTHVEFQDVWNGTVELGFGPFNSTVRFISSSDSKGDVSKASKIFSDLAKMKGKISLDGRLNDKVADQYLDKIGQTRFFYLYEIQSSDSSLFLKSWKFYKEKRKYGVIGQKPDYVKDIYLIANDKDGLIDNRPEFFGKLDFEMVNESIISGNGEKMYLIFVVSKSVQFNVVEEEDEIEDDYEPSGIVQQVQEVQQQNALPEDAQAQLQSILNSLKG